MKLLIISTLILSTISIILGDPIPKDPILKGETCKDNDTEANCSLQCILKKHKGGYCDDDQNCRCSVRSANGPRVTVSNICYTSSDANSKCSLLCQFLNSNNIGSCTPNKMCKCSEKV